MTVLSGHLALTVVLVVTTAVLSLGWSPAAVTAQDAQYQVEGVLTNADGDPLGSQPIGLLGVGDSEANRGTAETAADGTFSITVPDGTYHLAVTNALGSECTVAGYEYPAPGPVVTIAVEGGNIGGLEVTISGDPGATAELLRCGSPPETLGHIRGTVTDAGGEPVEGIWIAATPRGGAGGIYGGERTEADGSFHLRLQHGRYVLEVFSEVSDECGVHLEGDSKAHSHSTFDTEDGDIEGLRVVVSGAANSVPVWATCSFAVDLATRLQPGWNLLGWTWGEQSIEDLFDTIPELTVVHAWDADKQGFVSALRLGSELVGDLETLTPGMGLWLFVEGRQGVTWTRSVTGERTLRSTLLRPGWNLVTWMGLDGVPLADAVGDLGDSLAEAWHWNADVQRHTSHLPGTASSDDGAAVRRGDAFWVYASTWRQWWQLGDSRDVVFLGDIPPARQLQVRARIADVKAFFESEYGLSAPHFTTYISATNEDMAPAFLTAIGEPIFDEFCGVGGTNTVLISLSCGQEMSYIFTHEYFHVLQKALMASYESVDIIGTRWLLEGTAEHAQALYLEARGIATYDSRLAAAIEAARKQDVALTDYAATYTLGPIAVDWLVQRAGATSFIELWRHIPKAPTWQDAFRDVFGLSLDEFYELFEAYRAEVAPLPAAPAEAVSQE